MADENETGNNTPAGGDVAEGSNPADSASNPQDGENKGGGGDPGDGDDDKGGDPDDDDPDDGSLPANRRDWSSSDWAKHRINQKDNKGDDKPDEEKPPVKDEKPNDDESKLDRFLREQAEKEDKQALASFLDKNEEFKPFEKKIQRFMSDPSRNHLPIETVALEAVGLDNLFKIAGKRKQVADEKADDMKMGGGNNRDTGDGKKDDVWGMSSEEFAQKQKEIMRGKKG